VPPVGERAVRNPEVGPRMLGTSAEMVGRPGDVVAPVM